MAKKYPRGASWREGAGGREARPGRLLSVGVPGCVIVAESRQVT